MILLHFTITLCLFVSLLNTFLIWRIHQDKDGTIARLTSALLHTVGERQAADVVARPSATKPEAPVAALPQQRARQIGMSPR